MVLKIRLARFGKRHSPFFNIVVAHARTARNSKPLEVLGTFDPIPKTPLPTREDDTPVEQLKKFKDVKLDTDRARYWLGVGAQPSEPAWKLLSMIGLVVPKHNGRKVLPREEAERMMREKETAEKATREKQRQARATAREAEKMVREKQAEV
ncbi:ribosomal protein S16 [Elsinoe australis]|uniref:Ribosomal protein S16 n=1 Tax=Elsinoe australis TaxID=40998 RepID=A0A2P8AJR5_9PEZI|nr:ribosomal protein S16 [Elsinoe australis]